MALDVADRLEIMEILALHGQYTDSGELERWDEVFTPDVTYDISDVGFGVVEGLAALREVGLRLGAGNPVAHHVTNIVLEELAGDRVLARSKGFAVKADGSCGSASYEDTVVRTESGWRISHRVILARRVPLGGRVS
ncbi:nuclear transport factor 2 family protein [Flindersiella endophytica]